MAINLCIHNERNPLRKRERLYALRATKLLLFEFSVYFSILSFTCIHSIHTLWTDFRVFISTTHKKRCLENGHFSMDFLSLCVCILCCYYNNRNVAARKVSWSHSPRLTHSGSLSHSFSSEIASFIHSSIEFIALNIDPDFTVIWNNDVVRFIIDWWSRSKPTISFHKNSNPIDALKADYHQMGAHLVGDYIVFDFQNNTNRNFNSV